MYHHFGDIYFQSTTIQIILYCFSVDWNGQFFLFFILLFTFSLCTTHFLMNIGKELCPVRLLLVPSLKNSFIPFPCFCHWFFSQYFPGIFYQGRLQNGGFFCPSYPPFYFLSCRIPKNTEGEKSTSIIISRKCLINVNAANM